MFGWKIFLTYLLSKIKAKFVQFHKQDNQKFQHSGHKALDTVNWITHTNVTSESPENLETNLLCFVNIISDI